MPMKSLIPMQIPQSGRGDGSANDLSAEAALRHEIATIGEWLADQGLDLQSDHAHADEGSRDRLYLRYGYFIGLNHALRLLTNCGHQLH